MSITLSAPRDDPAGHEGCGKPPADRYEVRERSRATGKDVGVRDRFGDKIQAGTYATEYAQRELAVYGDGGPYELVVTDTWGWRR